MNHVLNIHYSKITFIIKILDNATLPRDKASAIRGGTGEYLLKKYCIKDRICEKCSYEDDCIVRKVMYSRYDIRPEFMTQGESTGYMWECNDQRERSLVGDIMEIDLTLFGKSIANLPIFTEALNNLGTKGIGRDHVKFEIIRVTDGNGTVLGNGERIDYARLSETTIGEYIAGRKLSKSSNTELSIQFFSPVSLKHNGEIIRELSADVLYTALCRRLHMIACYEGIENDIFPPAQGEYIEIVRQDMVPRNVMRYSNRSNKKIILEGIIGTADLKITDKDNADKIRDMFIAGEILHIGKNTSMGFGVYKVY